MIEKAFQGAKKKSVSDIFNFCKNDYSLVENTNFFAKSKFNSSANVYPVMTNDGELES